MRKLIFALLVSIPALAPAAAPNEVAQIYVTAMAAERWDEALSLVRADDLKAMAAALRYLLNSPTQGQSFRQFFDADSKPAELPDAKLMAKFFESIYNSYRERGVMSSEKASIVLLGSVAENADTVHFVQKMQATTGAGKAVNNVSLLSLVREGDNWFVVLPENLRATARSLVQQVEAESKGR